MPSACSPRDSTTTNSFDRNGKFEARLITSAVVILHAGDVVLADTAAGLELPTVTATAPSPLLGGFCPVASWLGSLGRLAGLFDHLRISTSIRPFV
jgi:hypothetical protein